MGVGIIGMFIVEATQDNDCITYRFFNFIKMKNIKIKM